MYTHTLTHTHTHIHAHSAFAAQVHGNLYGTSKESVAAVQRQELICLLEIDVQGASQVHESDIACHYLFIAPPSIDSLRQRLIGRKSETEQSLALRLRNAETEINTAKEVGFFERTLVNNDLEMATSEFFEIIEEWYPSLTDKVADSDADVKIASATA